MKISTGSPRPLGSSYDGKGTNFSVFSSIAQKVEVCFFDADGHEERFELPGKTGPLWHGSFEGIAPGQRYGFRVHGPWKPVEGHLCSPQKLLLDPYGKAVDGGVRWDDALFPLDPKHPTTPANDADTAPFMPRSVVVDSVFDWRNGGPSRTRLENSVIYEVHVKGFTIQHPDIPPELRGTYAGLGHPAIIDYFARLGVTAVELLPVQQFIHRRPLTRQGLRNYWGYDPVCPFAPHNEYAHDPSPGGVVNEFKEMVRSFHAAGIEVILDVVFNHTGEGGTDGAILCFKGFDNAAYYRLKTGSKLKYIDTTGTKNTLRTDHPQVRQLILDSLRYWASDMQIDGFRFDLAPTLVRTNNGIDFNSAFFKAVLTDPVLSRVKLIAEPWDVGDDGYQLGRFPTEWSEWNDRYRDDIRDYWNGRSGSVKRLAARFAGSPDIFQPASRPPLASVNMITCHDGFTLHDLVSYEEKHNQANGEDNRDGHGDNRSWNCGVEGPTNDDAINTLRDRQKRNFLATLLLSQGVPMLLGGDELGRTQHGNNNAYCQDNETSWFNWETADCDLGTFVSSLTNLRKRLALHQKEWPRPGGSDAEARLMHEWYDASGRKLHMRGPEATDSQPLQVWISIRNGVAPNNGYAESRNNLLVLFNPTDSDAVFNIPDTDTSGTWHKILDTVTSVPSCSTDVHRTGETITLIPHSLIALVPGK